MDKNFYNKAAASKLGWEPSWFGEKYFDDKLVRAIKKWQKANGLSADGMCGPGTYRRVWTERQANIDDYKPTNPNYSNYLVYNGNFVPIDWEKVILWSENDGLSAVAGNYYDYSGRPKRNVRLFVNHWDVCLNSKTCNDVLNRSGISVHFLIDNDGTIYQTMDMQHAAWHAGNTNVNRSSVGVEISNAYYPKYQDWYVNNGYGERSIIDDAWVHGVKLDPFMGFYPAQIEATKALWKAVASASNVKLKTRLNQFGKVSTKYEKDIVYDKYEGIISHYHCSKAKIDCAGLEIGDLIKEVIDGK
jgi:peptidoglycan hydrolase-like protein with peptidoglycan-binding domain